MRQLSPGLKRRLALVLGVLGVALAADLAMSWRVDRQLAARIAAIRAAADPVLFADLATVQVPPDQNAAVLLDQLAPRLAQFEKPYVSFLRTKTGKDFEILRDKRLPPTPEQLKAIDSILKKFPDIGEGIAAAAACDQYALTGNLSLTADEYIDRVMSRTGPLRTTARYQKWLVASLLAKGDVDAAFQHSLNLLKIARFSASEPSFICFLVAIAVRHEAEELAYDCLVAGEVSPEAHDALDRELARHDDPEKLRRAIKSERIYSLATMKTAVAKLSSPEQALSDLKDWPPLMQRMFGWTIKRQYFGLLDYYDAVLSKLNGSWNATRVLFRSGGKLANPAKFGGYAAELSPAFDAAVDTDARDTAYIRQLRIINALYRYKQEHGREAAAISDLKLPTAATIDPYSGRPMLLKQGDRGWVAYSLAEDGKDDGGRQGPSPKRGDIALGVATLLEAEDLDHPD